VAYPNSSTFVGVGVCATKRHRCQGGHAMREDELKKQARKTSAWLLPGIEIDVDVIMYNLCFCFLFTYVTQAG
jgi:hypothetical protein